MSIQALAWAIEQTGISAPEKLVLISIANHANREGYNSFPGQKTMMIESVSSLPTVRRSLKALRALELIEITKEATHTTPAVYRCVLEAPAKLFEQRHEGAVKAPDSRQGDTSRQNDTSCQKGRGDPSDRHGTGITVIPEPERTVFNQETRAGAREDVEVSSEVEGPANGRLKLVIRDVPRRRAG